MPVNHIHDELKIRLPDYKSIRDALQGHRAIRAERDVYLPVPPGMTNGGGSVIESGKRLTTQRYEFYLGFAEFPELIAPVLNGFQGIIHGGEPFVRLPSQMQYLIERANKRGDPLDTVWRRITREILAMGRVTSLLDFTEDDEVQIALYSAENMINWRMQTPREGGKMSLVVFKEVSEVPDSSDPFKMKEIVEYRELVLEDGIYQSRVWAEKEGSIEPGGELEAPFYFGAALDEIPLDILGPSGEGIEFEMPPMLPLVRRALSIYRLTADYRRSLYIKGDPQIVISGITEDQAPQNIGGDSIWTLPNPQATAAYLDIDGNGIPLVEGAIKDEYERFYQEGGKLLDTADRSAESGEALRRRQVAQQVSLRDIAMNAGECMERILKKIATIMGLDPNQVEFIPDVDFAEPNISGQDLLEIMTAKGLGAPLSEESIHALQRRGGLTNLTYKEESEKLMNETPRLPDVEADPKIDEPQVVDTDANDQ